MKYQASIGLSLISIGFWSTSHVSIFNRIAGTRLLLLDPVMAAPIPFKPTPLNLQRPLKQRGILCDPHTCGRNEPLSKDTPHIITPRRTWLRNPKPMLRWTAVEGITRYTVRIEGLGVEWEKDVDGTEVLYDGLALQPGGDYTLTVDANNGHEAAQAMFTLLTEEKLQELQAAENQLNSELTEEAKNLALAQLYIDRGIYADAIELLESLADKESQEIGIYCKLGEIYQAIGREDLKNFVLEWAKPLGECSELNSGS
jgi:hypothetical protein